jgi:outer membrane protein assembly factor BamB
MSVGRKLISLSFVTLACAAVAPVSGCESQPVRRDTQPAAVPGHQLPDPARPEIGLKELEPRGLEKRWDFCLREAVVGVWTLDDAVYIYTKKGNLYAMGLEDGLVRWQYALPEGLHFAPGAYIYHDDVLRRTNELFLVSKDYLHVLDLDHGFLLWKKQLDFPISCAPSASISHIYVGSWNGRIYAIGKDNHQIDWSYRTDGPIAARAEPAEKTVEAVFLGSEDGRIYSFNPAAEDRKWYYETRGGIEHPPFFSKTSLFVGSKDFNLYCIRTVDGNLDWRYPSGAPITTQPVAFSEGNAVYAVSGESNLLALRRRYESKKEQLLWSYPKGVQVLAKGRRDVYVLDVSGDVVALADDGGKPRWASPLVTGASGNRAAFFVTDGFDPGSLVEKEKRLASTIVLAYENGWIIAVREKSEF